MKTDEPLFRVAAGQHGLFTRSQARDCGFGTKAIDRRIRNGLLVPLSRRVLALSGFELSNRRRAMAAVLDAGEGALLSQHSSAALWLVPGFELCPHHVLVARGTSVKSAELGFVHTTTRLAAAHGTVVDLIPTTTPTRLAFDLSGRVHPAKLERAIENMWARRLTNAPRLYRMLDELSEHGRPRLQAIRDYLDPRGPNYRPAESNLELRVNSILKQDGQEPLVHQADVGDEHEWIGRVDLLDRELRVIVEVDSELYHGSLLDRQRDAERVARLEAAGFTVVQVREHDVWHNPGVVVAQIRAARRLARLLKAS